MHLDGRTMTFLIGDAGPLALTAVCSKILNQPEKEDHFIQKYDTINIVLIIGNYLKHFSIRLEKMYHNSTDMNDSSSPMPDELLYGRAGFLQALLFVKKYSPEKVSDQMIVSITNTILEYGKRLAKKLKQKGVQTPPLMCQWHEKKYLGAAHGMAGIIYLLLHVLLYFHSSFKK